MAKPKRLNMNGRVIPYEDARVHAWGRRVCTVFRASAAGWAAESLPTSTCCRRS